MRVTFTRACSPFSGCVAASAVPTCSSKSLREYSLRVRVRCLDRHLAEIVGTALELDQSRDSFAEDVRGREQANHKIVLAAEIVKMARMNEDVVCLQEGDGEVFIGEAGGEAQDRIPPSIRVEQFAGSMLRQKRPQVRTIFAQAFDDLRLERVALLKQSREGPLRGGIEREVGVRDDLQAFQRGMRERIGAGGDD